MWRGNTALYLKLSRRSRGMSEEVLNEITELVRELRDKVVVTKAGTVRPLSNEVNDMLVRLKDLVIELAVGSDEVNEAIEWIKVFKDVLNDLIKSLGIKGITLSKEIKSFIEDPRNHLRKKLFIYTHDLLRGSVQLTDYLRTATAAVRTSLKTNKRTLYQYWVLLTLIHEMSREYGAKMVYPEHGFMSLDRSGKQRSGTIPPNTIIEIPGKGLLSIFLEAPRPVSWEDSSDLRKYWRLYTALRPDIMIYGGNVTNILNISLNPPILKPDVIIECKELSDWYLRSRDVRGPFAKPLTAEEWRNKWIRGLWSGLSEVLGVKVSDVTEVVKERRGVRLKEYQVVALYKRMYNPKTMYLISRTKVPQDVIKYLSNEGIEVIDNVKFSKEPLRSVANELTKYAKGSSNTSLVIDEELMDLVREATKVVNVPLRSNLGDVIKDILRKLITNTRDDENAP